MDDADPRSALERALAGRYEIAREIGRGGMGIVYQAIDRRHDRKVAVKVIRPELAAMAGTARFLREISVVARLEHPHIVPLHDSGEVDGLPFYIMPYLEGESAAALLRRHGPLAIEEAVELTRQVALALDYAHTRGVVHRDMKPENILLSNGQAVVADFGVAAALADSSEQKLTGSGIALGSPHYMSPEQASGAAIDGRSDVYSLGCVLYELLIGQPPFGGATRHAIIARHTVQPVPAMHLVRDTISPELESAVTKALAKFPADRFRTAAEFADALQRCVPSVGRSTGAAGTAVTDPAPDAGSHGLGRTHVSARRVTGRVAWIALALGLVIVAAAMIAWLNRRAPLDESSVAIAPFRVNDVADSVWREGFLDMLSRNLDGAGHLQTISPSVVLARWGRRVPGRQTAVELGRMTNAGLVVYGALEPAGHDTVRVTATLIDANKNDVIGDVAFRDAEANMARLTDSLTVGVLRELNAHRRLGVVPGSGFGFTTSLAALKAFLRGEQFVRRAQWAAARASYEEAVALDSTLALAWRGIGKSISWEHTTSEPLATAALLRAGRLNRGLNRRDSLLVAADSLSAAASVAGPAPAGWPYIRRLFPILAEAVRRYKNDPEAWYMLGEARYHFGFGPVVSVSDAAALDALDKAIEIDSTFVPSLLHAIELGLMVGGPARAETYIRRHRALRPAAGAPKAVDLVARLIDPAAAASAETEALLDTVEMETLRFAQAILRRWPDSAETALRVTAVRAARLKREPNPDDPELGPRFLGQQLAYRGHAREAWRVAGNLDANIAVTAAYLQPAPRDSIAAMLRRRLGEKSIIVRHGVRWWASVGDSASIRRHLAIRRAVADTAKDSVARFTARYDTAAAQAYLTLMRGDTAGALRQFMALPDTLCPTCVVDRLTKGELLTTAGRDQEALETLSEAPLGYLVPVEIMLAAARGPVAARLGDCEAARQAYDLVARAWAKGDAAQSSQAREARATMERWEKRGGACTPPPTAR